MSLKTYAIGSINPRNWSGVDDVYLVGIDGASSVTFGANNGDLVITVRESEMRRRHFREGLGWWAYRTASLNTKTYDVTVKNGQTWTKTVPKGSGKYCMATNRATGCTLYYEDWLAVHINNGRVVSGGKIVKAAPSIRDWEAIL